MSDLLRVTDARCPNCGPRLWFDCEEHGRHDIPGIVAAYDMRTELVCDCGASVLVAMEPFEWALAPRPERPIPEGWDAP